MSRLCYRMRCMFRNQFIEPYPVPLLYCPVALNCPDCIEQPIQITTSDHMKLNPNGGSMSSSGPVVVVKGYE